jgi:hypothetical protein
MIIRGEVKINEFTPKVAKLRSFSELPIEDIFKKILIKNMKILKHKDKHGENYREIIQAKWNMRELARELPINHIEKKEKKIKL